MFAAEFGSGQVLWSILWFFLFFMWIWLVITIFADILRSNDLSGWGKALWSIAIIFVPFLGIFIYLIVRGGSMADRQMDAVQAQDDATQAYIRNTVGASSEADQLSTLADLHSNGKIDDAEYARAKAQIIGG